MKFEIIITEGFGKSYKKLSKKYPSIKADIKKLGSELSENPKMGVFIGKDCYKVRLAISSKGKGKSGGGRLITCVKIMNETVYFLTLYDKSEKENLTDQELDLLLKMAGL